MKSPDVAFFFHIIYIYLLTLYISMDDLSYSLEKESVVQYANRKDKDFRNLYLFSSFSALVLFIFSILKGKISYFIPYIIIFFSVIILIQKMGPKYSQNKYGKLSSVLLISLLYLLVAMIDLDAFYILLAILPLLVFLWVKEGGKEEIELILLWSLSLYLLFYPIFYFSVILYVDWVFPLFPGYGAWMYASLVFLIFYVLFVALFYGLLCILDKYIDGEHKLHKLEYSVLYGTIYAVILSFIYYILLV